MPLFTLDAPTEARWLDLPQGVRVLVKPLDGLVVTAARVHARQMIMRLHAAYMERVEVNAPTDGMADVTDDAMREAMIQFEFARGLARYGIIDWDGVGKTADDPLPFTTKGAEALAVHPDIREAFVEAYLAPQAKVDAEGNASPTAPDGSTDAVGPTATDAATSAPNAQD